MTIYIALLRGINVGGHRLIKMEDLKQLLETMGLEKVQTYIQSGNVLFESKQDSKQLSQRIQQEIETKFGLSVPVIMRTSNALDQIIKNCPFKVDTLLEGESIQLSLLADLLPLEGVNQLLKFQNGFDEYQIEGENIYLFFRQSIRNSKLAAQLQKIGVQSTIRNWKTISKLATMAKAME